MKYSTLDYTLGMSEKRISLEVCESYEKRKYIFDHRGSGIETTCAISRLWVGICFNNRIRIVFS